MYKGFKKSSKDFAFRGKGTGDLFFPVAPSIALFKLMLIMKYPSILNSFLRDLWQATKSHFAATRHGRGLDGACGMILSSRVLGRKISCKIPKTYSPYS